MQLSTPGTLAGNSTNQLTCVLTAPSDVSAQDQFAIQLTTTQGTTNAAAARLTLPSDAAGQAAAIRRARRVAEVPAAFRPAAAAFGAGQLEARDRARRAGTRPRSDRTLEINLAAVRDLARFLMTRRARVTGWQLVTAGDVEAFLAATANPAHRARQLQALRAFFRWARLRKMILADPTAVLRASSNTLSTDAC